MSDFPFVHLHFHTCYSLLDGATRVKDAVARAKELEMPALAITDHGVLYGAIELYNTCHKNGIKPIIGCEGYVSRSRMTEKFSSGPKAGSNHLVVLAENDIGYANMCRLISRSHLEGFYYKPRFDKELLAEYSKGLICTSACLGGEVAQCVLKDDIDGAVRVAGEYADILGKDNFFLEIEDHGLDEQTKANRGILEVAKRTGLQLVATNDSHYLMASHFEAHEVMLCMQTQTVLTDPKRMRYGSDQFYMKSGREMWDLFGEIPESLNNTVEIAKRCNVEIRCHAEDLHFPHFDLPEGFTEDREYLIELGARGLRKNYGVPDIRTPKNDSEKELSDRFFYELSVIEKTGFVNYFLVVQDFIQYAKSVGIPVGPGRGSGAGSMMAYALGITGLDPLEYDLIFERFLNPERVSPPDFDIDFCPTRRHEVIEYVKDKYGRDSVAQILTFGTLGAKTVIRDIGRVLEMPFSECEKLSKMIPEDPKMTLKKAIDESPDFARAVESDPNAQRIIKYAEVLEGLPRQPGVHAAGVVIGEKPLIEILPLGRDKSLEPVTQYEKVTVEDIGLLKMDFLGLKNLTVIKECVDAVNATYHLDLDIEKVPLDDKETYELLCRGDAVGVFQLESPGMRDLLRNLGPTCIQDVIALIALYRPGPMDMIPDFIKRKHGEVAVTYEHPLLEDILKETYGVMIYQEQVQRAANVLAGFSLGQGDILRRAMGKKKVEEMVEQRKKFVEGCMNTNKIEPALAGRIFDNIEKFAGYGFNKSHSAAYGYISYWTAYLKAHHPAEFMAGLMSCDMNNPDKLQGNIAECKVMGMEVLPPSINASGVRFCADGPNVRFGMAGIKNVGTAAVQMLVKEREADGPFKGLLDFCSRIDSKMCNRKTLESLVSCGAFDEVGMERGRMFAGVEFSINRAASAQKDKARGQSCFFDMLEENEGGGDFNEEDLPVVEPWTEHHMLISEKELLGFYISGHPLARLEWIMDRFATRLAKIDELNSGRIIRVGGLVTQVMRLFTKKKKEPMGKFVLEGLEGSIDVVAFPEPYASYGHFFEDDKPVIVCGELEKRDGKCIKVLEMYPLEEVPAIFSKSLTMHLPTAPLTMERVQKLTSILQKYPGRKEVGICLELPEGEKVFTTTGHQFHVKVQAELLQELEHELGENSIYLDVHTDPCLQDHSRPRFGGGGPPPDERKYNNG